MNDALIGIATVKVSNSTRSIVDTVGPHSFINVDAGPLLWRDARFGRR